MRTTVTLDEDVAALVKRTMKDRDLTFKEAVNDAIRRGMAEPGQRAAPDFPTFRMGAPLVDLTKALQLSGSLEDQELVRKLAEGK